MYADQGRRTVYEEAAGDNKKAERIGMKIETLTGNTVYFPYITVGACRTFHKSQGRMSTNQMLCQRASCGQAVSLSFLGER